MHRYLTLFFATLFVSVALPGGVEAQDDAIREAIEKAVEKATRTLSQELEKVVEAAEKKVADLEKELEKRDQRIAELEAKIRELAEAEKPPQPPARPAFLGVGHVDPPEALREDLEIEKGALVTQVVPGSPAAEAGIEVGDVLVAVGDSEVSSADLGKRISGMKPGEKVDITVIRDGKKLTRTAKLVDREKFSARQPAQEPPTQPPAKKEPVVLGIRITERDNGIFVSDVEKGFTGKVAGLENGDRLVELNGKKLAVIEDVVAALKPVVEGDELTLVYERGDEKITAKVIGAHGEKGARLVGIEKAGGKPEPEPAPEAPKKPGFLGVSVLSMESGVQVESVVPETAAAAAGVQKNDLIREINGQKVENVNQLKEHLSKLSAGDKVKLKLERDGKMVETEAVLAAEGEKVEVPAKPEPTEPPPPEEPGRLGIKASQPEDGVVRVAEIEKGGPADQAGLQVEDVVLEAQGKKIDSLDDLAKSLEGLHAGDTLELVVQRGEKRQEIRVTLGRS